VFNDIEGSTRLLERLGEGGIPAGAYSPPACQA